MKTPALIAALCAALLCASPGAAATSKAERVLRDLERSLCRGLKLTACKKKIEKRTRAAAKQRSPRKRKMVKVRVASKPAPARRPVPLPRDKPVTPETAEAIPPVPETPPAPPPPLPRDKPAVAPPRQAEAPPKPAAMPPPPIDPSAVAACRMKLRGLGAAFETVPDLETSGGCAVADPVRLSALESGGTTIAFPDTPVLACAFAGTFAEWLKDAGAPIALAQAKSPIAKLWTGPGYECRGRNGDASGKLSEHGYGNAADIASFALADGRRFDVNTARDPAAPGHAILKGLRGSACGYFTTVLGPGSNAAHAEHFHFDLARRGKNGNYRICE